ncbi:hypothetical protein [Seonamhaeicola maritimus]|uniref:hypothetical protein n=1 Tax=Seonamhaeicola maritimus TaxID=2591822 RepID=UPI00249485EE|nr:hypothetical protein [Seonamhaeicola maritimus]
MIKIERSIQKIKIEIPQKFAEKHIGSFMHDFYNCYRNYPNYTFYFDFTKSEWITNQNLLLLSSVIKYLYYSDAQLRIRLLDFQNLNKRKVEQICELWYVWEFSSIFDKKAYDFENYIETFTDNTLKNLCTNFKINFFKYKDKLFYTLYEKQFSVVPFISLNHIENAVYENSMGAQLKPVYALNENINNQLNDSNCSHPFVSKTISAIITKELYDNFLDHFKKEKSLFNCNENWAFMSISLKRRHSNNNQKIFKENFEEEELEDAKTFFYNSKQKKFINEHLIQFSFIDFGSGIVETLLQQFAEENQIKQYGLFDQIDDNEVLKYAFRHNTSRNPILDKYEKINKYIPRGLYALLVIVKRYRGILIVRSNYGKILYNFSEEKSINDSSIQFDGQKREYFPGTYISIYIPAWEKFSEFDKSVIQPEYRSLSIKHKPKDTQNINLFSIASELSTNPDIRYKSLIEQLYQKLSYDEKVNRLTYINFFGVSDRSIIEKTIFFLVGTYDVNYSNSIIIVHPPKRKIIEDINNEILELDKDNVIKDFKINPIPLIYLNIESQEIDLDWIGIFEEKDKQKLNDLLFDVHSLLLEDFNDGYKAIGNINTIDKYGNFISKIPVAKTLLEYYKKFENVIIKEALKEHNCEKKDGLYLCNGNYYQESFLQLTNVLNSREYGNIFSQILIQKIKLHLIGYYEKLNLKKDIKFIAITASSHKILKSLISNNKEKKYRIKKENCIFLESYLNSEQELSNKIEQNKKYILVCDVISTGNITRKLDSIISQSKSELILVAVFVNTLDSTFKGYQHFKKRFIDSNRFLYLHRNTIKKFNKRTLSSEQNKKELIRINPYTNIPIVLSDKTTFNESILLTNKEFLECVDIDDLEIRLKLFNNLIHPFFFITSEILRKENQKIKRRDYTNSLIYRIFTKLKEKDEYQEANYIFYPKHSDIESLEVEQLQIETKIFGKGGVKYFELERYNPGNGWKFPHTVDYFRDEIKNEVVLILDDGSCSGDSLYQMANELSYYLPKTINIISIIGRVENHKREFFSKINTIKSKAYDEQSGKYKIKSIDVNIYFGAFWHIPTFFLEMNPYIEEYNWLEKLIDLQNTPMQIKAFAKNIKSEITPKSDEELHLKISKKVNTDYKFFPKAKNQLIETKKEILIIRNEIGKIIGYRFYKESFDWFNDFINKSHDTDFKDRFINQDIEHLLMCFIYEPYLYKHIIRIIPEIKEIVRKFIESIIFERINLNNFLNYEWSEKDIVHLYFIAYTDKSLVRNLTLNRFEKLVEYIGYENVNYILFKLLYYSPKNDKNYSGIFKELRRIIGNYSSQPNKKINLYKYFIASIPYGNTFNETIDYIGEEYQKILSTSADHKESIKAKLDSAASNIDTYVLNIGDTDISTGILFEAKEDLQHVIEVMAKILTLSDTYPAYFSKFYTWFELNDNSLRNRYNSICNFLEDIDIIEIENIKKLLKHIREIKYRFCDINLAPYNIFLNPYTFDFTNLLKNHVQEFLAEHPNYEININCDKEFNLAFPKYILEEIVIKNILSNFKEYADYNSSIAIQIYEKGSNTLIEIENKISKNSEKEGSYIGTHLIKNLNDCPSEIFNYRNNDNIKNKDSFLQTIKIKTLNI